MIENNIEPFQTKAIINDKYDLLPDKTFELTFSTSNQTS